MIFANFLKSIPYDISISVEKERKKERTPEIRLPPEGVFFLRARNRETVPFARTMCGELQTKPKFSLAKHLFVGPFRINPLRTTVHKVG